MARSPPRQAIFRPLRDAVLALIARNICQMEPICVNKECPHRSITAFLIAPSLSASALASLEKDARCSPPPKSPPRSLPLKIFLSCPCRTCCDVNHRRAYRCPHSGQGDGVGTRRPGTRARAAGPSADRDRAVERGSGGRRYYAGSAPVDTPSRSAAAAALPARLIFWRGVQPRRSDGGRRSHQTIGIRGPDGSARHAPPPVGAAETQVSPTRPKQRS